MTRTFIFKTNINLGIRIHTVDVYRIVDGENEKFECVLDADDFVELDEGDFYTDNVFTIAKGYVGEWYDADGGGITHMSELLGQMVEENYDI